jgi:hypothetical protein
MRPEDDAIGKTPEPQPAPLEYAPQPGRPRRRRWLSRFLTRLSSPMPLGMYYVIMFVLGIIALILALVVRVIVDAFR